MEDINLLSFKIGGKDPSGKRITNIYIQNENYFFYEIKKNGLVNKLFKGDTYSHKVNEINISVAEFSTYLTSRRKRRVNAQIIANAYNYCVNDKVEDAREYLKEQIRIKQAERVTNNRLSYLITCMLTVIFMSVITVVLNFIELDDTCYNHLVLLFMISTFGSFGGLISVSIKVNKLEVEIFNRSNTQIWLGISRIFIAIISSLIVFVLIKANIIFGFIENIDNKYILYSMASLSGFSEYFIPNTLKQLESKE